MSDFNPIITTSGKITSEIYHLDIKQYNIPRSCSVFLLETPESVVIMDTGTSNDINSILGFMKNNNLSLKKVKYLVPSHHHFDHLGGGWKLWKVISEFNPDVKILTLEQTKKLLQNPVNHLKRAKRTYGDLVGTMEPLHDDAYEIVEPDEPIKIPGLNKLKYLQLISTPGHTFDHVCPTLFENNKARFTYLGEAAGGLLHSRKLVTLPSSMPPEFNFKIYIQSLEKIIDLKPLNTGYAHAGVVKGHERVIQILQENWDYSFFFREFVRNKFLERGETRYVVEQFIEHEIKERSDVSHNDLYTRYVVAVVYGQLMDLGLKSPK